MHLPNEFAQLAQVLNPGAQAAVDVRADVWLSTAGEFDAEGTLLSSWTGLFPPDTVLEPLAEVLVDGNLLWVSGLPELRRSLLTNYPDHVEAPLKSVRRLETLVDVLRDADSTDTNELGDPVETQPSAYLIGITASITETSQKTPTADGDLRTTRVLVGWVPAGTDVRPDDRLQAADGNVYSVEVVTQPFTTGLMDLRLDLLQVARRLPQPHQPYTGPYHSGEGPPPAHIAGARYGDVYMDTVTGDLYELRG